MKGGWNLWDTDWGITCGDTCGGATGGGSIFTVCDSNGECGTGNSNDVRKLYLESFFRKGTPHLFVD